MPILTQPIHPDGAIVSLGVVVSGPRMAALKAAGVAIPDPVLGRALLDTGASATVIDLTVVAKLRLVPTGAVPVHTPSTGGTPAVCEQYDVGLALILGSGQIHMVPALVVPVIAVDLSSQGIQALIGRDVLREAVFVYNGDAGTFTLAF